MLRIIDSETVRALYPIGEAIPDMVQALTAFSAGKVYQHPRITLAPPQDNGRILLMPAASGNAVGIKVLSMFPRAAERGLPWVQGLVILLDATCGEPLAVIDGTAVTAIRTAAVTALATDRLAPPEATVLGVLGAGVQAREHILGLATIRRWQQVRIYSRTADRAKSLVEWAEGQGLPARLSLSAKEACDADVICTVTSAISPVIRDEDVRPRTVHINAVGAFGPQCRELPTPLIARSRIFVDSRDAAFREAGDILIPLAEGAITKDAIVAEIGEVLAQSDLGRQGDSITVFKSLGLPIEDVVACETIYHRAVARAQGKEIAFP
jgi:ornithine cyclodeaminase/alanine dehydrogenase-like protein (mu-crystallin family)